VTSPCLTPRCSGFAEIRGRCRPCASQAERERQQQRGPRLYDTKRWRITRRRVLFDRSICEHHDCDEISTDVHHLQSPEERPDLAFSLSNLAALCHACHSRVTRNEQINATGGGSTEKRSATQTPLGSNARAVDFVESAPRAAPRTAPRRGI
jgi:hypothetical protein